MSDTKRLGRGLEALLGPMSREQAEATGALRDIAVASIAPNPFQPRRSFNDDALAALLHLDCCSQSRFGRSDRVLS